MFQRSNTPQASGSLTMRLHQPDLRSRTKAASLHAIKLFKSLPENEEAAILGKRMLRTLTRAGAYYRAAVRCRRLHSYLKRLDAALYDLELAAYWLELLIDGEIVVRNSNMTGLLTEVHELMAIMVSCRKKAKKAGNQRTVMSSN
jgi:four helix bundle protein